MKENLRRYGALLTVLFVGALWAGCTPTTDNSGDTGTPSIGGDTTAPTIAQFEVSPSSFDIGGGVITFTTQVSDAGSGVNSVFFEVTDPIGLAQNISASLDEGDTYSGTYTVPANTANATAVYQARVVAYDNAENVARSLETSFEVSGVLTPPSIPEM